MIQLQHISKTFHPGEAMQIKALQDVSLTIGSGEYVVVIGANGSGKSTLLNIIAGSYAPDQGELYFDKMVVNTMPEHRRSPYIARLFQNPLQGTAPDLSILENFRIAALRSSRKGFTIGINKPFRQRVADSISRLGMGLEKKLDQNMGKLSGGQRQALTLLMSTMDDCKILLMDEPSAALDPRSAELIMQLIDQLIKEKNLSALLVTHRMKDCIQYGTRVIHMKEGRIGKEVSATKKQELRVEELYGWFDGY